VAIHLLMFTTPAFFPTETEEGHEEARLDALQELDLLDTPESESFDRITRMASRLFNTPIAAVSLTDRNRQWFKSHVGTEGREIPRLGAPCAAVTASSAPLIISDLLQHPDFSACLLAQSGIRFYAGAPLITRNGYVLGAMCVLDKVPREVSPEEIASLNDFAAMVMAQVELEHDFGRTDPLSGLPNRNQLLEDLEDQHRKESSGSRVILLVDVADPKHFNRIVSVLGTGYIDALIRGSSRAIRETIGRKTGLYHVGSGSFVLVLDETKDDVCQDVVDRLTERLKVPILCQGVPVMINAAFGISPFTFGELTPRDVLRTALSAVHNARELDVELSVYNQANDDANRRHVMLLTQMQDALRETNQLSLHYQPKVDVRTNVCVGAEALLRWNSPSLGHVSPGEFIPLAEQTALAGPVTEWVIASALSQIAAWRKSGLHPCISINVSASNLEQPEFSKSLAASLERFGVPAKSIELEFTESAFIRNRTAVLTQMKEIRSLGVGLAIDDFGTGYSSFSYLQDLPATTVKIDQAFIRNLHSNTRDQALVRTMIAMAHDLGYHVVAEGVETLEAYNLLAEYSCDQIQGYFVSRPLLPTIFEQWFTERPDRHVGSALRTLEFAS
jgi:EAL domain-containing protein (putative c-di-GMP-specific phosphodiesterase class I)/GAF domain-containing protein